MFPVLFAAALLICAPAEGSPTRAFGDAVEVDGGSSPHAFADALNRIHVTYISTGGRNQYRWDSFPGEDLDKGLFQAVGPDGEAWHPRVSVSGGNVFVLHTFKDGNDYFPRLFRSDAWGASVFDGSNYSPDYLGNREPIYADVETADGFVYIIADGLPTVTLPEEPPFFWTSFDGFSSVNSLTSSSTTNARYPALAASGSNVYAAWVAGGEVRFNMDGNSGAGFDHANEKEISDSESRNAANYRPGIAAAGDWVFVVWSDGTDVWFVYCDDNGSDFSGPEKLAPNSSLQTQPCIGVSMSGGSPHLRAVWRETSGARPHIRFQEASWNSGSFTWGIDMNADGSVSEHDAGETIPVAGNNGDESFPTAAVSPTGVVYVVWENSVSGIMSARYLLEMVAYEPEPPADLKAEAGNLEVNLSWTASVSSEVDSYRVYRSTMRGDDWGTEIAELDADATEFKDDTVNNNTIYWYIVRAVSGAVASADSNQVNATPREPGADIIIPEAPTNLRAVPGSGMVSITWIGSKSDDIDRHHVYSRTDDGDSYKYAGAVPEPGTEFLHEGLTSGVTYQYVVTAVSSENQESEDSEAVWAVPGTGESGVGTPPGFSHITPAPAPTPVAPRDTPGAGSGCFIATAAYGSGISEEVLALSTFRDEVLLGSRAGRMFVSGYYALSPALAEILQKNFAAGVIIRLHLFPLIRIINAMS